MRLIQTVLLMALCAATGSHAEPPSDINKDVQTVVDAGRGSDRGRAAWERLSGGGWEALLPLLRAMDNPDVVTANWLRTAFDRALEGALKQDQKVDADGLLAFVRDARRQGRARRLALEVVEHLRPGTTAKLLPGWLDDPEFRFEAVAVLLGEAAALAKKGAKDQAEAAYRKAFDASRDVQQGRAAAVGLLALGSRASVAEHLGFLTEWYLIGPFDAMGMKGFHTAYPPEQKIDLTAELDGKNGKVRWKRYKVREPAPTGGGHVALVNLATAEALGNADDAVAFAYTTFTVPAAREVEFRGAADDNFTVWVNGVRAFGFEEYRNGVRLDRHRFKVALKAGVNTVLVKICQSPAPNPEPNWEFFLRVADETGKGIPLQYALPADKSAIRNR